MELDIEKEIEKKKKKILRYLQEPHFIYNSLVCAFGKSPKPGVEAVVYQKFAGFHPPQAIALIEVFLDQGMIQPVTLLEPLEQRPFRLTEKGRLAVMDAQRILLERRARKREKKALKRERKAAEMNSP